MAVSDPIADMLTMIRNASSAGLPVVKLKNSNFKYAIAKVLKQEGFIGDYSLTSAKNESIKTLNIYIKFDEENKPVIRKITKLSKPGRRLYVSYRNMERVRNGLGLTIVSTSQGVISDKSAREKKVGGELICSVL